MVTKALPLSEKEAAAYFFEVFNSNLFPMTLWKYDGSFPSVNDAFLDLLGYSRKDFEEGKINWRDLTPPEYEEADENCVQELKSKGSSTPFYKEFYRKDGSRVGVQINNCLLNKSDDHGIGIILEA